MSVKFNFANCLFKKDEGLYYCQEIDDKILIDDNIIHMEIYNPLFDNRIFFTEKGFLGYNSKKLQLIINANSQEYNCFFNGSGTNGAINNHIVDKKKIMDLEKRQGYFMASIYDDYDKLEEFLQPFGLFNDSDIIKTKHFYYYLNGKKESAEVDKFIGEFFARINFLTGKLSEKDIYKKFNKFDFYDINNLFYIYIGQHKKIIDSIKAKKQQFGETNFNELTELATKEFEEVNIWDFINEKVKNFDENIRTHLKNIGKIVSFIKSGINFFTSNEGSINIKKEGVYEIVKKENRYEEGSYYVIEGSDKIYLHITPYKFSDSLNNQYETILKNIFKVILKYKPEVVSTCILSAALYANGKYYAPYYYYTKEFIKKILEHKYLKTQYIFAEYENTNNEYEDWIDEIRQLSFDKEKKQSVIKKICQNIVTFKNTKSLNNETKKSERLFYTLLYNLFNYENKYDDFEIIKLLKD